MMSEKSLPSGKWAHAVKKLIFVHVSSCTFERSCVMLMLVEAGSIDVGLTLAGDQRRDSFRPRPLPFGGP